MSESIKSLNIKDEDIPKLVKIYKEMQSLTEKSKDIIKESLKSKTNNINEQNNEDTSIEPEKEGWEERLKKIVEERNKNTDTSNIEELTKLKEENKKLMEELKQKEKEMKNIQKEKKMIKFEIDLANDIKNTFLKTQDSLSELKNIYEEQKKKKDDSIQLLNQDAEPFKDNLMNKSFQENELFNINKVLMSLDKKDFHVNSIEFTNLSNKLQTAIIEFCKKNKIIK